MTEGSAPRAKKVPTEFTLHNDKRVDPYFWLKEKENPEVMDHLKAENAYTEAALKPHARFQTQLFEELKARLKEDDQDVPVKRDEYYYYSRQVKGEQYAVYCRKHLSLDAPEEVILDCNALAKGRKYFELGLMKVSPKHDWLAYAVDLDGAEEYTIFFKNLKTGAFSSEQILKANPSFEWGADNKTLFYTLLDENHRPDRLLRHVLGTDLGQDVLLYKEGDPQFFVYVSKSLDKKYLFLTLHGKVTGEVWFLDSMLVNDSFRLIEGRRRGIEYSVDHHEGNFYILTNDTVQNFRLVVASASNPGKENWKLVQSGNENLQIESCEAFKDHLVVVERAGGLNQIRITDLRKGTQHMVEFPEPTYIVNLSGNVEFNSSVLRLSYSSLVTPNTIFDYDMNTRQKTVKKVQEIPSGYDSNLYQSERIFATSHDGTQVPISLVYRKDFRQKGPLPVYLYGYGSYGHPMSAYFSTVRLSLLDRGFIFAMAHVRGGSDLGRPWYENGKFLKKKNTFHDFIACADHLIEKNYTRKGDIVISGGSAGGMLVGATVNMRPDLFRGAIANVPFVDVLNTMLDHSLPLTTLEFEEWGNPQDSEYYHYIKSYSPYDNVEAKHYPHMLITAGLNDPRVTYWEPAKWVARLRELKTDNNLLLFYTFMEAGHGGPSGRYDTLKEMAMEYTFVFKIFGLIS